MNVRAELASRFVDVEHLPWEKTAYAGIEQKTLLVDKATGLITALMRMAPGARLPDHEHVKIEQTYVLEGSLRKSIDGRLLAADLFGGLGLALSGAALYTFLTRPSETKSHTPTANVSVAPGYAAISLEQRF